MEQFQNIVAYRAGSQAADDFWPTELSALEVSELAASDFAAKYAHGSGQPSTYTIDYLLGYQKRYERRTEAVIHDNSFGRRLTRTDVVFCNVGEYLQGAVKDWCGKRSRLPWILECVLVLPSPIYEDETDAIQSYTSELCWRLAPHQNEPLVVVKMQQLIALNGPGTA